MRTAYKIGKRIKLLACICRSTLGTDTADILGTVEDAEPVSFHDVHKLHELHAETCIGLVAAVILHGIVPCHARELLCKLNAAYCLEEVLCHTFEQRDYILLLYKTHLAVNLSEFGLTVGTQVLVAETLHYLEVTVEARYHKQLLEELRALRKSIELTGIHAGRNDEVTRTLRR